MNPDINGWFKNTNFAETKNSAKNTDAKSAISILRAQEYLWNSNTPQALLLRRDIKILPSTRKAKAYISVISNSEPNNIIENIKTNIGVIPPTIETILDASSALSAQKNEIKAKRKTAPVKKAAKN